MIKSNENGELIGVTKEQVLALDCATHTGYAWSGGGGTWNFQPKKTTPPMEQYKAFLTTLVSFIKEHDIKVVVVEGVNVGTNFIAMRKLAIIRGLVYAACCITNINEPMSINVSSIKKWATGDGKADKKKMIEFAKKRWNVDVVDDNHADALHIYKYFIYHYHL